MVTQKEIIAALLGDEVEGPSSRLSIAEWIEAEGIAPPDGWVLVPSEPTAEMVLATNGLTYRSYDDAVEFYKAMLAAAPKGVNL